MSSILPGLNHEMQISLITTPAARSDGIHTYFLFVLIESEVSFLFLKGA